MTQNDSDDASAILLLSSLFSLGVGLVTAHFTRSFTLSAGVFLIVFVVFGCTLSAIHKWDWEK